MKNFKFLAICVIAILSMSLTSCMHTTDPGYASVINERYGSEKGVQSKPVGPGTYYSGFGQDYYDFPTFQVNWSFTADETEGSPSNEEFTFQTKEGMECSVDLGLAMHFDFDKLPQMYTTYRKGVDEIRGTVVRNAIRDALNRVAGNMPVESVYGNGKGLLIDTVSKIVKAQLAPNGIVVDRLSLIGSVRIPQSIKNALNSKVQMTQDAQKAQNEVVKAEAEAKIKVAKAQGDAEAMLTNARAEAEANKLKNSTLTPLLVQMRWIEAWEAGGSTVPTYVTGNAGNSFMMSIK